MVKIGEVSIDFVSKNGYGEDISVKAIFHNAIVSIPTDLYINMMKTIDTFKPDIKIEGWESAELHAVYPDGRIKKEESHFKKGKWYEEEEH
jgi:hypothetical protein